NTLGFDDEFLRFSFHRNLLPPYTHQFANQCGRMDLYPMAIMYYLFKPNILIWPKIDEKISFKLDQLSLVNQLAAGRAHNAMVDVEATLALARLFFQEKDMWNYLKEFFNKKIEQERLEPLKNNTIALLVDGRFARHNYQSLALYLGQHKYYKNQSLWLLLDISSLVHTTQENIENTTRVINKKPGEPCFILPLKKRFINNLLPEQLALAEANKQWLDANPQLLKNIFDYYANYQYPVYPNVDMEASLYTHGFYSSEEEQFCRLFHHLPSAEKAYLTDQSNCIKPKELALRILGRHFPDIMNSTQKDYFSTYMKKVYSDQPEDYLIDFQGKKRMTPAFALSEIKTIRAEKMLSNEQHMLLTLLEYKLKLF
ncbi:MAG: exodeoxyribonuclease I, partial [Gammaproteobacteria bacterium]|nr:exodeoxyribonuclease I [Gammaproteobacteria bacterium]